jgi:16S rRNA (adenine1518-N6/adenine1519-N6)-dimethyltransferase
MFKPHRYLGQNFLIDRTIADQMVSALEIENGDEIVEIGSGFGIITEALLKKSKDKKVKINAVEIDGRLYKNLVERFSGEERIEFHNEDFLRWFPQFSFQRELKIIGSVPYYITSPIIHQIIKADRRPKIAILLVQKEVAEKIKSTAPDSSYLSSFVQTFFDVQYLGKVPSRKFNPEPEVDGGVLKLICKEKDEDFLPDFIRRYEGFLHKAYSNPRKMLNKVFKKDELEKGKIDPHLRPQNLDAEEWLTFFKVLNDV